MRIARLSLLHAVEIFQIPGRCTFRLSLWAYRDDDLRFVNSPVHGA